MAHAFVAHLIGDDASKKIRGIIESGAREADDDEFAELYGLV